MKVAVYYNNNDIRIEERPRPSITPDEILVKMKACGICGTDVMEWYRIRKAPRVLGHEMTGEIEEVGEGVTDLKVGDRVFVSHHVPCYRCYYCLQKKYTACEALHGGNYDPGGFSEFIRVPKENVRYGTFKLPDSMTYEEGAMIEPLACALSGQNQLGLKKGQTAVVIGSGISGISHIQLLKLQQVEVIAMDINTHRLKKAIEFGADFALNANEYSADALRRRNNDRLADVVIVCAAARKATDDALSSIGRKGKILFFAVPDSDMAIPSVDFWRNEITATFSYGAAPADLEKAIQLIDTGKVNVGRMITHRVALSDIMDGFKMVIHGRESLKVVVVPN